MTDGSLDGKAYQELDNDLFRWKQSEARCTIDTCRVDQTITM